MLTPTTATATVVPVTQKQIKRLTEKAQHYGIKTDSSWWKQSVIYLDPDQNELVLEMHVNAGVPRVPVRGATFEEVLTMLWYRRNSRLS